MRQVYRNGTGKKSPDSPAKSVAVVICRLFGITYIGTMLVPANPDDASTFSVFALAYIKHSQEKPKSSIRQRLAPLQNQPPLLSHKRLNRKRMTTTLLLGIGTVRLREPKM
jgi:hypothetical protein